VIRGELKAFVAVAFLATALASPVFAAATVNGPRVQLYGCSVSNDPSPPDFSVPAGALPLGLAMADFTGDRHPDLATLELDRLDSWRAHYVIEIQLTEGGRQSLRLTAPARSLIITPMDVTGDGTLDLVVRSVGSKVPVAVFLNDGCGHFSVNESARFSTALRDVPIGPGVSASHLRFDSAAIPRGPYAADFQLQPRYSLRDPGRPPFLAYDGALARLFLPLRTERAPPAAA
jgi:hypothetical protein